MALNGKPVDSFSFPKFSNYMLLPKVIGLNFPLCNEFFCVMSLLNKWDALRDLVPFLQFKKNVKNTHGGELLWVTKINASPWVFFTFFKLRKWYQIAESITNTYCWIMKTYWIKDSQWKKTVCFTISSNQLMET